MTVVEIVERERGRLRAAHVTASVALTVAVTVLVIVAGAWLLADARWIALPRATPLAVWVVLIAVDALLVSWAMRRVRAELARASIAAAIEREQQLRAGAIRGVLEVGQQSALGRRADRTLAGQLEQRGPMLAPAAQRASRRRAAQTLAVAGVTLALLLWAAPTLGDGLLAIRRPIAAWRGTLIPALAFRDVPVELLRGEPLTVKLDARGRRQVRLIARSPGEGWRTITMTVDGTSGIATTNLGPVRGDVVLVASDGRAETDTTIVRVTDRPFVGGVVLRAVYPGYLARATEGLPVGEPARVPQGTVIEVSGRASTALRSVYVRGEHDSTVFASTGQSFSGRIIPRRTERLDWFAFGTRGAIGDVPLPIDVEVIPDSVPRVELVSPATDTIVATSQEIVLQVSVTDDHGVVRVDLETERDGAKGRAGATASQRLAESVGSLWNGTPKVDLAARDLQPGDALRMRVVAVDNSPWAQRGVSRELVVRVPTMEERRSIARAAADSAVNKAQAAIAAQKSLEQRTDEASRERGNRDQSTGAKGAEGLKPRDKDMSFESAEKARGLTQEQKQLAARVDSLRESAKKLEEQLRQAAALDSSLARQLKEAQDLLRDALTPDLMAQMQKLEDATRQLSGDQAREALKNLAEMQRRLREQLEKSAEMLKRAAIEGAMETLKDEAKEIAEQQRDLAGERNAKENQKADQKADQTADQKADQKSGEGDKSGKSDESRTDAPKPDAQRLAQRSDRLAKDVQRLQDRLEGAKANAGAQKTASAQQHASSSGNRMRQQDASGAAQQMDQAAQDLEDARDRQVAEWKQELTSALDQSIQELLQMARQESSLEEQARSAGRDNAKTEQMRGEQSAVKQGVDKTGDRLQKEGQKSSLLSGRAQRAMQEAQQRVSQATQQLADNRAGQQSANSLGEAADALNRAAAALARDRERANTASSATGFAEMLQQMQEMAKKQGSINAQAQGLLPLPGQSMSQESQATARALARQQRGIAQQLDDLSDAAGGDRAAQLAKEARALAEVLEQTKVDASTVARQQQLFRKLLDAGRSLEKEEREDNDKREAKAATGDARFDPGSADARGRAASRFREPTWDELRGLSADERRAILEYFKRINAEKP